MGNLVARRVPELVIAVALTTGFLLMLGFVAGWWVFAD